MKQMLKRACMGVVLLIQIDVVKLKMVLVKSRTYKAQSLLPNHKGSRLFLFM